MAQQPSDQLSPDERSTATTRRRVLALGASLVGTTALAGCLGSGADSPSSGDGDSTVESWMSDALDYDGVVDETGSEEVTVAVGAGSDGGPYAFAPAGVRVSTGTRVVWEWTGKGGAHNVVEEGGAFASDLLNGADATFEYTASEPGTYRYVCEPHRGMGMKGVLVVE